MSISAILPRATVKPITETRARADLPGWSRVGSLTVVLLGLFALPRRVRPRDLDAELPALGTPVGGAR